MRTIVAFLLAAFVAAAQTPADIERLEKRVADHPDNLNDERALFLALMNPANGIPFEKVRAERRRLIVSMIEHQPESKIFDEPFFQLWTHGPLGDPEGYAQAVQLWKDQAAKPGAAPKAIANAALFFKMTNAAEGFAILDAAAQDHPNDPDLSRARGILHASVMLGVSGVEEGGRLITSGAKRATPAAAEAREAIEASKDAHLVGGAGDFLSRNGSIVIPYDLTFGDDDVPTRAERWLRRARELDPPGDEWSAALANAIHQRAQRTNDPNEKLRLLAESASLMPDNAKLNLRPEIVNAEFASGDDASAGRDAHLLADAPRNANDYNLGQTILGRIAMARGDAVEAKERLRASVTPPAKFKNPVFEPNMALAQDVYDSGDRDAVIEFLEASRVFWKFDRGRIDRMISFVKKAPSADLLRLSRELPGNEILRHPAPPFEATDLDGKIWTREQLAGTVVALEFGDAPLVEKVAKDFSARGAVLLKIQDSDIKRRFEVLTDPTLVTIDRQGNVAAFRSGVATEADWKHDFESAFGGGPNPSSLAAPRQVEAGGSAGGKATLAWEPVDNAESYVVEWDTRDESGWVFDRDRTVRVIPTRDSSAILDLTGLTRVRWRVYAVPARGAAGKSSPWREIDGVPFTKIYK